MRTWKHLDRAREAKAKERVLLKAITKVEIEFYSGKKWLKEWSGFNNIHHDYLPEAVKFTFETENFGVITRIFITGISTL